MQVAGVLAEPFSCLSYALSVWPGLGPIPVVGLSHHAVPWAHPMQQPGGVHARQRVGWGGACGDGPEPKSV